MPIYWKILSKKYLSYIFLFTLFFIGIIIFFKLSRFAKYFVSGVEIKEISLLLSAFIYKCAPFGISLTSLSAAYLVCSYARKNNEVKATSSLGLSPQKLFFPLIALSSFLSLFNGYMYFAIGPKIYHSLSILLKEKTNNISLLTSLAGKENKEEVFLQVNPNNGDDFLLVQNSPYFTFALADKALEHKNSLQLINSHFFQVKQEKNDYPTISLVEDKETFIPKTALFSLFHPTIVKIPPIQYTPHQTIYLLLYLLYPITFTLLGISLAIHLFPIVAILLLLVTITSFALSTLNLSFLAAILSCTTFLLSLLLYILVLKRYTKGVQ